MKEFILIRKLRLLMQWGPFVAIYLMTVHFGFALETDTTFILSGQIEYSTTDTLRVIRDHQVDRIKVPVDEEGRFHQEIPIKYPRFIFIQLPVRMGRMIPVYAEPGDSISLSIRNGGLTDESPYFQGNRMNENNLILGVDYLQDSLDQAAMGQTPTGFPRFLQSLPIESADSVVQNILHQLHEYLDTYAPALQNTAFIRFMKKRAQWDMINHQLNAILSYNSKNPIDPDFRLDVRKKIQTYLDEIDLSDGDLLGYDHFKSFIFHVLGSQRYDSFAQWRTDPKSIYALYKEALQLRKPEIRDKAAFLLLTELIKMNPAHRHIAQFDSIHPDGHYLTLISKWSDFYTVQKSGIKVPDFHFLTLAGDTFYLNQLQGKLIYVDFWATWCKPCIEEYPYFVNLKQDYKNENIEFVSISLDNHDKEDKWRDFIQNNDMTGHQFKAENGMQSGIRKWLKIKQIPVFALIGADGILLDGFAPRPSSPNIHRFLNDHLGIKE